MSNTAKGPTATSQVVFHVCNLSMNIHTDGFKDKVTVVKANMVCSKQTQPTQHTFISRH